MNRTVDYGALTRPVSRDEVRAFRTSARTRPQYARSGTVTQAVLAVFGIILVVVFFSTIGGAVSRLFHSAFAHGFEAGSLVLLLVPVAIIGGLVVVGFSVFKAAFGASKWERWLRLEEFATANELVFSPASGSPGYPGAIFGIGGSRQSVDHVRSTGDRFFDLGSYTYVTGSGKSRQTHDWGFLALSLDRALPHMVLDSKSNNALFGTNLPATFRKDQVLSLEGNFDEYFTLYCPKEYERDALYVFTPDLMALLIDHAAPFDVEIVDKWMFVYSSRRFNPLDPVTYQRLFRIIDTVGSKTLSQTDRYVDERIGDFNANIVAPPGKRLTRGVSVASIVVVVAVAVMWGWPFLSRMLGT